MLHVCSPLFISEHGDEQATVEPARRSFSPPSRNSQHPDDNSCSSSAPEVVREEHGQTVRTSVTHSPWRDHLCGFEICFHGSKPLAGLLSQTVSPSLQTKFSLFCFHIYKCVPLVRGLPGISETGFGCAIDSNFLLHWLRTSTLVWHASTSLPVFT